MQNQKRVTHTDIDRWEEFIKYSIEMVSYVMIYVPSFVEIGLGFQKLMGRRDV
jgi:hypothetical protein